MNASRPLFPPRAMASQTSDSMVRVTVGSMVRPCMTRQVPSWITTVHCPGSRPDRSNRITASTPAAAAGSNTCGSPSTAAEAVVGWKVVTMSRPSSVARVPAPSAGRKLTRALRAPRSELILAGPAMRSDRSITERILNVLRPYASNWSGTLGRGDLVIPQREIPRVIHEILAALHEDVSSRKEAGDRELFDVLMAARRSASVQDQADLLRRHFIILLR